MKLDGRLRAWIDARKRHRLSHAQIQMARELGMNPEKLGKIDNHRQEPWKTSLPEFIEHLYRKRFRKDRPDDLRSIEEKCGMKPPATPSKPRRAVTPLDELRSHLAIEGRADEADIF